MSPVVLPALILCALCVIDLAYCFRGYKSLRTFAALYGFWVGYSWVLRTWGASGGSIWIGAIVAGALLAALAFFIVKAAFFLAGGLLGLAVYYAVLLASPDIFAGGSAAAGLICFVGFGLLAVFVQRPVLIIATSCYGAYAFVSTLGILLGVLAAGTVPSGVMLTDLTTTLEPMSYFRQIPSIIPWIATILLAVWGMVRQFRRRDGIAARRR